MYTQIKVYLSWRMHTRPSLFYFKICLQVETKFYVQPFFCALMCVHKSSLSSHFSYKANFRLFAHSFKNILSAGSTFHQIYDFPLTLKSLSNNETRFNLDSTLFDIR